MQPGSREWNARVLQILDVEWTNSFLPPALPLDNTDLPSKLYFLTRSLQASQPRDGTADPLMDVLERVEQQYREFSLCNFFQRKKLRLLETLEESLIEVAKQAVDCSDIYVPVYSINAAQVTELRTKFAQHLAGRWARISTGDDIAQVFGNVRNVTAARAGKRQSIAVYGRPGDPAHVGVGSLAHSVFLQLAYSYVNSPDRVKIGTQYRDGVLDALRTIPFTLAADQEGAPVQSVTFNSFPGADEQLLRLDMGRRLLQNEDASTATTVDGWLRDAQKVLQDRTDLHPQAAMLAMLIDLCIRKGHVHIIVFSHATEDTASVEKMIAELPESLGTEWKEIDASGLACDAVELKDSGTLAAALAAGQLRFTKGELHTFTTPPILPHHFVRAADSAQLFVPLPPILAPAPDQHPGLLQVEVGDGGDPMFVCDWGSYVPHLGDDRGRLTYADVQRAHHLFGTKMRLLNLPR